MIQNILSFFFLIFTVNSFQYALVAQDLVSYEPHTWKDDQNNNLAAVESICPLIKQPYLKAEGTTTLTIFNEYQVNNNDHEVIFKVIFNGDWNNEIFSIYSDTTLLKGQSLSSQTWSQTICQLQNTQTLIFQLQVPSSSLTSIGSLFNFKLKITIPGSGNLKGIYISSIIIYELLPDSIVPSKYIENEQFDYFTEISQNPSTILPAFTLNTLDTILNSRFDIYTIGEDSINYIIGGYSLWNTGTIKFTKTLKPHYAIKLRFLVYQFDSPETLTTPSNFKITINTVNGAVDVPSSNIYQLQSGNFYGDSEIDSIYYVDYEMSHFQTDLEIIIELSIISYVGITNFNLISMNCPQFCLSCKSKGTCENCASIENRNLVSCQCMYQYFEDLAVSQCKACDYRCDICEYDGINETGNCLICRRGFDVTKKCATCTNSYQYENQEEIICENCANCCLTCSGPTDRDCITFRKGWFIMPDNQGVKACPSNYFAFTQTVDRNLCIQCDLSCKTCASVYSKCTSCYPGYQLSMNRCFIDCPISTYRQNQICLPCADSQCERCNELQCLRCLPNKFLSKINKKCQSECESGYFKDIDTRTCKKCHQTCKECVGQSLLQCSQCQTSQYMLPLDQVNIVGVCYKVCKEGYFPSGQFCNPCFSGCLFCTSYSVCQMCISGYYLYNNFCVEQCPSKMYPNNILQKCLKCNTICKECSGKESYQCKSCSGTLSLYEGSCFEQCPLTTISINQQCEPCTVGCDICTGINSNDCQICSSTYFILNGQCYNVCPPSYQANIITQACEFCIQNCETCISNNCKLCELGYYFQNGLCNRSCTQHFYKSTNDRKCKECDETCETCSGSDYDNCLTCPGNYKLFESTCLPVCPNEYYSDNQNVCHQCHSSCLQCNGPLNTNCLNCSLDNYLYQSQCLSTCPDGTYGNDDIQKCLPCHSSCLTCQGGTQNDCLTCPVYIERMKCVTACSVNFILDATGKECIAQYAITLTCSPQCATCSLQESNCNTCYASRYQKISQCVCNKGFFDVGQPDCSQCQHQCQTCAGTADSCLICKGNRYGATCLCPDYYYEDGVSENCPKCDYKCGLCTNNICSTCADRRINAPTCECPDGYFDNLQSVCQPCDNVCSTCKDFAENCLTCSGIRINPPFCTCPSKFFDFQSQCIPCPFECDECDSNGCSTCNGNMSGPYKGKCICKDGYSRKSIGSIFCTNCDLGVPYAILLSGLTKISVDFGGPLALVTVGQSGCDQFFQTATLSTLGTSPTCQISTSSIIITLGKLATIEIGHSFQFANGFRLRICSNPFPNFKEALLRIDPKTSDESNLPFIVFGAQQAKTICEDINIKYQLSNTGSRNLLIFSWSVTLPLNYVNQQLQQVLQDITPSKTYDTSITIPKLILSKNTIFQLKVQLKNFLNLESENTLYVETKGAARLSIVQPETKNTFQRYEKVMINYTIGYTNCTMSGVMREKLITKIEYNSKVIAYFTQEIELEMETTFQSAYLVDEFILKVGTNDISVTLSIPNQNLLTTEHIIQEVAEGTLIINILGGNIQVGDTSIINMTAKVKDQDIGPVEKDSFVYDISWACLDVLKGTDCFDSFGKLLKFPNGRNVTVYASALQQYNSYIFIATTQKGNKKASGKSMIQVVEIDLPQLSPANSSLETETIATVFNYYDEIQLSFTYETKNPDNLFYSATILYDQNVQKSFQFYSLTFQFKLLDYFTDLNTVKGNQITLRVSIYNPSFVMPSLRSITLTFNLPPRNCKINFNNENNKVIEFETLVNMTVTQCEDEDMPIQYKVLFYKNNEIYKNDLLLGRFQNNIKLSDYQQNNTLLFTVPYVGSQFSSNYTSLLLILIKDSQNGIFNITYPINVYQNNKLDQVKLSKMIDHNVNIDQMIQTQDLVVSKLIQQTNYSEFKYSILRKNDLLSTAKLSIEQQNSLFQQMTQLINDEEVAKEFDINLQFLSNYKSQSAQNYETLLQLQSQSKTTLEQQAYIDNYYKTFDLFSALIKNSQYFSSTNDQVLENMDIIKSQLIDFTVQIVVDLICQIQTNNKLLKKLVIRFLIKQLVTFQKKKQYLDY